MKIEIDAKDLKSLQDMIEDLEIKLREAKEKIASLDEDNLRERAVYLAKKMFESVIEKVFITLGFWPETYSNSSVVFNDVDLFRHFDKPTRYDEKIECNIKAHITNSFKRAFLNIGVITEEKK